MFAPFMGMILILIGGPALIHGYFGYQREKAEQS